MNKNLIAIAVLAASALTTQIATAASGTVKFEGKITADACDISGSKDQRVPMGTIATNSFNGAGSTSNAVAASKSFELVLEKCPTTVSTATVSFDGTSVDGDDKVLALTGAGTAGVATGVGIQISDADDKVVPLHQESSPYTLQAGTSTLKFVARYYATAATVGAGSANAVTNFTIVYP